MKKITTLFVSAFLFMASGCFRASAEEQEITLSITIDELEELDIETDSHYNITLGNDEDFSYYNQLDANNKAFYDAMESTLLNLNDTSVKIQLSEKLVYYAETKDMSEWSEEQRSEYWSIVSETYKYGESAFMLDHPEVFWRGGVTKINITISKSYDTQTQLYKITIGSVTLNYNIREQFSDSQEALEAQNLLIEQINSVEIDGDDYYTKLKNIHDYICKRVTYIKSEFSDTAFGVFNSPYKIVCEGYAECFKMLCEKEGIPCISIIGNYNGDTSHMWNYVKMEDNRWYGVDVAWDDIDDEIRPVKYEHFLRGADRFLEGHNPDAVYGELRFVYPQLSEDDYEYLPDEPEALKGDFSQNGVINVVDLVILQKQLLKALPLTADDFNCELISDGKINVWDYVMLLRVLTQ